MVSDQRDSGVGAISLRGTRAQTDDTGGTRSTDAVRRCAQWVSNVGTGDFTPGGYFGTDLPVEEGRGTFRPPSGTDAALGGPNLPPTPRFVQLGWAVPIAPT